MKREDKFGRRIFSATVWSQMLSTGKKLIELGYTESVNKPNLFYSKREYGMFFADMRGTEIVPIWDDPCPLFYWNFDAGLPPWKCRRYIKEELLRLGNNGAKCRLSFYFMEDPLFDNMNMCIDEEDLIFEWNDGYCQLCGKDFRDEGSFCSPDCEKKFFHNLKKTCPVCGKKIEFEEEVKHHIKYAPPEKAVFVHLGCHTRIHRTKMYPELKPVDKKEDAKREFLASNKENKPFVLKRGLSGEQCAICEGKIKPNESYTFYKGVRIHVKCYLKMKRIRGASY